MPHHYHLKIPSAILWITFLGIALGPTAVLRAATAAHYYGTSASVSHLPVGSPRTLLSGRPVSARGSICF